MIRRDTLKETLRWWVYCRAFNLFGNTKTWPRMGAFLWS